MFGSFKTFFILAAAASTVIAEELIVIDPAITSPTAKSVWKIGSTQTVTWEAAALPPATANTTGLLLIGFKTKDSENLNITNPLATQFLLGDGKVNVTTPNVNPGKDYIVVLFGDSGNVSPEFTITA